MKKLSGFLGFLLVLGLVVGVTGCDNAGGGGNGNGNPDPIYDGFYNYPTGRVDQNAGRLTITNTIASEVLLFEGKVDKANYIGTIGSLGSVRIKLPDQKFYTIVAVQKSNYEERRAQAAQFNSLTYYSDTQPYTISVSPSTMWGGGNWVFNNNTNYWVQVRKADLSQNYAVIQPNAQRVTVPITIGEIYDYSLYFSRELKYNGVIVALVEGTDPKQNNTAQATAANPTYTTPINNIDASASIKPSVLIKNDSNKTVRVYYSQTQKTNGTPSGDFVVVGGQRQIISGFETGDNTSNINFSAGAWTEGNKQVPAAQGMAMQINKIYEITIPSNEDASQITVVEVNASNYYN
jgi:hypothetical protein